MNFVRIDDYPYGTPWYDINACRKTLSQVFDIFEANQVPYVIGVTPELIDDFDIELLNNKLNIGRAVMHGFDHAFGKWNKFKNIIYSWPLGGEFKDMTEMNIVDKYACSHEKMFAIKRFDDTHFIAPFNCYTQAAVSALAGMGVKYIHTCDKEFEAYHYADYYYQSNISPVISRWQRGYDFAFRLLPRDLRGEQITLHWMYDTRKDPDWIQNYHLLCAKIKKEGF